MCSSRYLLECSNCGMTSHIRDNCCNFCGSKLFVDKIRHFILHNITYVSYFVVLMFAVRSFFHIGFIDVNVLVFFEKVIIFIFVVDFFIDKFLLKRMFKGFLRYRFFYLMFIIPLYRTINFLEFVPQLRKWFRKSNFVDYVFNYHTRVFIDIYSRQKLRL